MKNLALSLLVFAASACDSGGGGASVTVDQDTDTHQGQTQNEPPLDCNVQCTLQLDGTVTVVKNCEGAAPAVVTVESLPSNCNEVNQIVTSPVVGAPAA